MVLKTRDALHTLKVVPPWFWNPLKKGPKFRRNCRDFGFGRTQQAHDSGQAPGDYHDMRFHATQIGFNMVQELRQV